MLGWSYPPNVEAGEDIRILVAESGSKPMSARAEILPELESPARVHQITARTDLDELDTAPGELQAAG